MTTMILMMMKKKKLKSKNLLGHLNLERELDKMIVMIKMTMMMLMIDNLGIKEEENQKLLMRL